MATLSHIKGNTQYPCPMCATPVSSSAVYCPTCATDLTRAGAVFTSSGTSVPLKRRRGRRAGVWVTLVAVTALGVTAATIGRPWASQFAGPGLDVLKAMARTTLQRAHLADAPAAHRTKTGKKATTQTAASTKPVTSTKRVAPVTSSTSVSPARPATATLTVSSTPRGARVQIDGIARGITPVTINGLRAGPYKIRISHSGYRSMTRLVTLEAGKGLTVGISLSASAQTPALPKGATLAAPPVSARPQAATLVEVGRPAPHFVAKDRVGLLYRSADLRGRRFLLVFVQTLDGDAQRIVRELNALYAGGVRGAAVVVVLRPDRVSIRRFTQAEHIQIPVLFGTQGLARAYGVDSQRAVLYLVSEEGRVVLRQVGRVNPRSAMN